MEAHGRFCINFSACNIQIPHVSTGYTKHYFAGTERLASAIGNGGLADVGHPIVDGDVLADKRMERDSLLRRVMAPYPLRINRNRLDTLYAMTQPDTLAELIYFFHPDHLGSASWITDLSGQPVQHLQYKPFGGDYIDQQDPNTDYSERFRFTGKERDAETGYDYFGARYYSSSLGIWLSVDPMSDKYPTLSPYVYCADNPMRLVDLEGTDIFEYNDILVQGMNNSSITIKTNLVDMKVNAQPLGIDFGGNFQLEGYEVLSAALDLAGIVDPTGIADGANAVLQAKSREYFNAAISAAGLLPYIGDIAKVGKIKKDIQIIEKAIDAKSINQLNDIIKRGKTPKIIIRFDNPKIHSEKPHVHFSDGTALNKDGTWKHNNSNHKFINTEIEFLQNNGWKLP